MPRDKPSQLKTYYLVLIFFFIGLFLRLSINGFNVPYPGNLKSVDSFLHSINTAWIIESHQITRAAPFLSNGHVDVVFFQPPLLYLNPAALSFWTGLEAYNSIWFYAVLVSTLPILLFYVIGEKIFNSKKAGILSSALYIIPASSLSYPSVFQLAWIYPVYIGLWNLVIGKTLFLTQLWLLWEVWKKPRYWTSLLLGIVTGAQILSHIPETLLASGLIIMVYGKILLRNFKKNLIHFFLFILPAGLSFFTFLPKLLGVWLKTKPVSLKENPDGLIESLDLIRILWLPILILFITGIIFLLKKRENRYWLFVNAYFFLWLGLIPVFFKNQEYFEKLRFLAPLVVFPIASVGGVWLINFISKRISSSKLEPTNNRLLLIFLIGGIIAGGMGQYSPTKQRMGGEEMTIEKYEAMLWLQENSPENSKVLLLNGFHIASGVYSKRLTFQRDWIEYTDEIKSFHAAKNITSLFNGRWLEEMHNLPYEKSFFSYGYHKLPSSQVEADTFDYIVMWDVNGEAKAYNKAQQNMFEKKGFISAYNKGGMIILEKKV
jgi:hypothetical protein